MWDGSVLCWNLRCTTVSLVDVVPSGSRRVYCLKCSIYRRHYVQPLWAGLLYVKGHGLYLNVSGMNVLAHLKQQNCQPLMCHGSNAVTRKVESHKYVTFIRKSATPGVRHWFKLAIPKFDKKYSALSTQSHDHLWLAVCVGELWPRLSLPVSSNREPGLGMIGRACPGLFSSNEGKVKVFLVFSCSCH